MFVWLATLLRSRTPEDLRAMLATLAHPGRTVHMLLCGQNESLAGPTRRGPAGLPTSQQRSVPTWSVFDQMMRDAEDAGRMTCPGGAGRARARQCSRILWFYAQSPSASRPMPGLHVALCDLLTTIEVGRRFQVGCRDCAVPGKPTVGCTPACPLVAQGRHAVWKATIVGPIKRHVPFTRLGFVERDGSLEVVTYAARELESCGTP